MAKTEKTQVYIVTQRNTLDHKVGDEIKLTDKRAKDLSGKVKLKADGAIDKEKTNLIGDLKKSVVSLQKDNGDLVAEIELLKKPVEEDKGKK